MKKPLRDVAASVRQRLLTLAHASGQPDGELLDRYCIERRLYRLSRSPHREQFILKGAMLLTAWGGGVAQRVTRDADLSGFGDSSIPALQRTFREICATEVEEDGVQFDLGSIRAEEIRARAEYAGVRIELRAVLGGTVVPVQVDVGFGDAVRPAEITFPSLLDLPQPMLRAYARENFIAEKFEATNSRNTPPCHSSGPSMPRHSQAAWTPFPPTSLILDSPDTGGFILADGFESIIS